MQLLKDYLIGKGKSPIILFNQDLMPESYFVNPPKYIQADKMFGVISAFYKSTKKPISQSIDYGLFESKVNAHGNLGMAVRTAPNMLGAITVIAKYTYTRQNIFDFNVIKSSNAVVVRFKSLYAEKDVEEEQALKHLLVSTIVNFVSFSLQLLSGHVLEKNDLTVCMPIKLSKTNYERLSRIASIKKTEDSFEIHYSSRIIDLPFISSMPSIHHTAVSLCEEELSRVPRASLIEQVVCQHIEAKSGRLSITELAIIMNMSVSTLQRRLAEESTDFSSILTRTRIDLAKRLLLNSRLTVNEVSHKVGYQSVSSFIKAFKSNSNSTPFQYQKMKSISAKDDSE